jgi:hypothetical protein
VSETTEGTARPASAIPVGGKVVPIIPQDNAEIMRLAKGAVASKFAPDSLTKDKTPEDAALAVATAMMAGAELGIPPMAALRSFTVINGKPALYGDGITAVVRRSGMAKYIRVGFTNADDAHEEALLRFSQRRIDHGMGGIEALDEAVKRFGKEPNEDMAYGWCEAERVDTGEMHREVFTVAMAKHAGLWQDSPTVTKRGRNGTYEADAGPWFRYRERMLQWRATGYCLRHLFSDVLGGITDEYEARSAGEMVDVTPSPAPKAVERPRAPALDTIDISDDEGGEEAPEPLTLEQIDTELSFAQTEDDVLEAFDGLDVQTRLPESQLPEAFAIRNGHIERVKEADSDGD